jgi:hypothetical protein
MGGITLLLGKTRARRRRAMSREAAEPGSAVFPDFLYLAATQRKKEGVEREYLAWRKGRATFVPRVEVLSRFLEELARDVVGAGPVANAGILTPEARILLAQQVLQDPAISLSTGSSIGAARALALFHAKVAESGRAPASLGLPKPQTQALEALGRALTGLPRHVPLETALRGLLGALSHPDPHLSRILTRSSRVILDDVLQLSALRSSVLVALGRAWAGLGVQVVACFESGGSLGGAEAGSFFEYDPLDSDALPLRPFETSRELRRTLFDNWIAEGSGEIQVADPQGVFAVEPGAEAQEEEAPGLTDLLFRDQPLPVTDEASARALCGAIQIRCHHNAHSELETAIGEIKQAVQGGLAPGECVLAVADLSRRADTIASLMVDHGLPYRLEAGAPLAREPCCARLVDTIGRAFQDSPPPEAIAESIRSALVAASDGTELLKAIEAVVEDTTVAPNLSDLRTARAWAAVGKALEQWRLHLASVQEGPWPGHLLWESLVDFLEHSAFRLPGPLEAVQVVEPLELRGLTPRRLWVTHLTRGQFPSRHGGGLFRDANSAVDPVDPMAEARYLLLSAMRNTGEGIEALCLSWPASVGGKPATPAPALQEVLHHATLCPEGRTLGGLLRVEDAGAGQAPEVARSRTQLLSARARWGDRIQHPSLPPGLALQRAAVEGRSEPVFGAYDGLLQAPPPPPSSLSVTAAETYLQCPARYWYQYHLRLGEEEAYDPDVPALARGSAFHQILEEFVEAGPSPADAAQCLHDIAAAVFDALEQEADCDLALLKAHAQRWLAGLVDDEPAGPLRAWLDLEHADAHWREPLHVELPLEWRLGPVVLRGKLDRIDRLPGSDSLLVIDYKTGKPPTPGALQRGQVLQPIAYAQAAKEKWPGKSVGSAYYGVGQAEGMQLSTFAVPPELTGVVPRGQRPLVLDPETLDQHIAHARAAMERLVAGVFHPTLAPPGDAGCAHCDFRRICRTNPDRAEQVQDPGLQRPLELDS